MRKEIRSRVISPPHYHLFHLRINCTNLALCYGPSPMFCFLDCLFFYSTLIFQFWLMREFAQHGSKNALLTPLLRIKNRHDLPAYGSDSERNMSLTHQPWLDGKGTSPLKTDRLIWKREDCCWKVKEASHIHWIRNHIHFLNLTIIYVLMTPKSLYGHRPSSKFQTHKYNYVVNIPTWISLQQLKRGAVFDENTGKILVVQDRNKLKNMWKFPGGLSEPGEDIGDTAVREVFEETGIRSEFRSLLSLRQQHTNPGAFGKSDMYIICRLKPHSFTIDFCQHECLRCEWMDLSDLAKTENTTPITSRVARLLLYGYREGFDKIDFTMEELPAVYTGLF